jgi:hypothetical protein
MEYLSPDDVTAINKLLDYAAIVRAQGRRCDVELQFNSEERMIALKLDAGGPGACFAVAYEPTIPEAVDRVLDQASVADADNAAKTDPAPPPTDLHMGC